MSGITPLSITIKNLKEEGKVNVNGLYLIALEEAFTYLSNREIMDVCRFVKREQHIAWEDTNNRHDEQVADINAQEKSA